MPGILMCRYFEFYLSRYVLHLIMVGLRGLHFPSRFLAKFEDILREIQGFLPSIFYFLTAFVINPTNDVLYTVYKCP
jgi:hypothetical protein